MGEDFTPTDNFTAGSGLSKTPRKKRGGKINHKYGDRNLKYYPLSESELWSLFTFSLLATTFFSLGFWLFSFGFDVLKDISLNNSIDEKIITEWKNIKNYCFIFGGVFIFLGAVFAFLGGIKIKEIKDTTDFGEE